MTKHFFYAGSLAVIAIATRLLMPQAVHPDVSAASAWSILDTVSEESIAAPRVLELPTLNITANIVDVGLDENGAMENPPYTKAGWYAPGPKPGERGNAVIAGHLDTKTDIDIFWNLKKLKEGDPILVVDETGELQTFHVESVETYDAKDAPMDRIFGPSNERRLNLVTCAGVWKGAGGYDERLVVYAVKDI
jgi:sortase A